MLFLGVVELRQSFGGLSLSFKQHGVVERALTWKIRDLELRSDTVTKYCTNLDYLIGLHFLTYKEFRKEYFLATVFILLPSCHRGNL